jgi:hypothetical protein
VTLNKSYILFHLNEAEEELRRTIEEIKKESGYGIGEYSVAMGHIYHHVNSAWNARFVSEQQAGQCSENDFQRWRQFPADLAL